ncbi:FORKED 1 protein [Tanacetum coccineum]
MQCLSMPVSLRGSHTWTMAAAMAGVCSIASAATLVADQCVEVAEAMGTERGHLIAAVNMRSHGDKVAAY